MFYACILRWKKVFPTPTKTLCFWQEQVQDFVFQALLIVTEKAPRTFWIRQIAITFTSNIQLPIT